MIAFTVLVWILASVGLFYVYGGYLMLLRLALLVRGRGRSRGMEVRSAEVSDDLVGMTVYFAAFNEEDLVGQRIENILQQEYPPERMEVLVISDGSTDATVQRVKEVAAAHLDRRIRVVEFPENRGKAAAQNAAAEQAMFDVLLSTDADTVFARDFMRRIAIPFRDPTIGVVGGGLAFRSNGSSISSGIGAYRRMELAVRRAEGALGVLVKTDAACTAYRRRVWSPIEAFEDVDHVIVLLARKQGLHAAHVDEARCEDSANSRVSQELRARSRMTRKGILTIRKRWQWDDMRRDPWFTIALFSHRYARYLSPVFLLLWLGAAWAWGVAIGLAGAMTVTATALLAVLTLSRWLAIPGLSRVAGQGWSFLIGNVGFALGMISWLRGDRSGHFTPSRRAR